MNFRRLLATYLSVSLWSCLTLAGFAQGKPLISHNSIPKTDDEFVGPFNSWLNAITGFGAKGDGVTDDTRALQAALDAAATGTVNSTLYLPAGIYLITATLIINHHINVSVIGADPANTIIKWGGPAHGTMLQVNGTAYSRFNRITWDGKRIADVAVEQSWDGNQPHFDTGNEYADDIFIDVAFGIRGGNQGHGFAETSILRDHFIRNTKAGVSLGNFNALDIWVRSSLFQDCGIGVTNTYGAGNFRVYNSVFRNSVISDISMNNTGDFSVRGNTSINGNRFFYAGNSRNPASIIIEGNTVIDPVTTLAIAACNQGPIVFINNTVRSRGSASGTVASFGSNAFSMGNTFTVGNPVSAGGNSNSYNKTVSRLSLKNLSAPTLPGAEPNFNRRVFEVPAGANSSVIQAIVNKAARLSGTRPVVHFSYGNYNVCGTIFIPANSDMQLVGDGFGNQYASMLTLNSTAAGPMLSIAGPSRATIRDITFKGNALSTTILITNADQKGARIFMQEFHQVGGQTGLLVNQLNHTFVFAYDGQFSGLKKAVSVIGGPMAAQRKPAEGRTIIYSGAESNNELSHEVANGGNLMVQDAWYEGGVKSTWAKLSGKSIFIADGDHMATPQHAALPTVMVNNFSGEALFTGDDITGHFSISGKSAQAKILTLGIMAENDSVIMDASSCGADLRLLMSRARNYSMQWLKGGSSATPDIGTYDARFISTMMADMLSVHPIIITSLPAGVSDIRLYRVMLLNGATGVDVEAGPGSSAKNGNTHGK